MSLTTEFVFSNPPIDHEFLDKCAKITEAYDQLSGGWSLDSQLLHIISEIGELRDVLRNKKDKYGKTLSKKWYDKLYDELADVHLTVFSTDNFLNKLEYKGVKLDVSNKKVNDAIIKKLGKVEQRVKDAETQ